MAELPLRMRRLIRIVAILAAIVLLVVGVSMFSLYEASQQVPDFYRDAVAREADEQTEARDRFVAQVASLVSDLHHPGRWQSLFTAEQINAWLALELANGFPELLPEGLSEPRISLRDSEATIACRYENSEVSTVLSLTFDAYLKEPNVLVLRIRRARAGALPMPLAQVLDAVSHAARELKLRLEWRKTNGDPVALITFAPSEDSSRSPRLQAVELRDDELFLSGVIGQKPEAETAALEPAAKPDEPAEDQPVVGAVEKETRQE